MATSASAGLGHGDAVLAEFLLVEVGGVDAGAGGQREQRPAPRVPVLEQGQGAALRIPAGGGEVRAADGELGCSLVDVGVVEQPQLELHQQQTPHGQVEAFLGQPPGADEIDDQLGTGLAAELVAPGLNHPRHPVVPAQVLHAPGARGKRQAGHVLVGDEAPIGADDAVVPELVAQQRGNDGAVESEPDFLHRRAIGQCQPDGHAVVGHQRGGAGCDSGAERLQVVLEAPAGVDLLSSVGEMRVLPVALRSSAGKMLGHAGHAGGRQPLTLEAPQIGGRPSARRSRRIGRTLRRRGPSAARSRGRSADAGLPGFRPRGIPAGRCRRIALPIPGRRWRRTRAAPATGRKRPRRAPRRCSPRTSDAGRCRA